MKLSVVYIILFVSSFGLVEVRAQTIEDILIKRVDTVISNPYPEDAYRYTINTKWIPEKIKQLEEAQIIDIEVANELPKGYETVTVRYNTRSGIQKANIQVYIDLEQWAPLATMTLRKGEVIDELSYEHDWVNITRFRGTYITDVSALSGKAAGRLIKKDEGFQLSDIVLKPVVAPGDLVDLVFKEHGINIIIPCIARQNKAIGEHIRLLNKDTGRTYLGILTSKTSATWEKTL